MAEPESLGRAEGARRRETKGRHLRRSVFLALAIVVAVVVYAYGFQVVDVDLGPIQDEHRQQQLFRIIRALGQPDVITYDEEEVTVGAPVWMPCPPGGVEASPSDEEPRLIITPPCTEEGGQVQVEGEGFAAGDNTVLSFRPPSGVNLRMERVQIDGSGRFVTTLTLPAGRTADEAQSITALTVQRVGGPKLSRNAILTWEKIVETVFLALLATTAGTILAIPLSFFAARNLMRQVSSPITALTLSIIAIPVGGALGLVSARTANSAADRLGDGLLIPLLGILALALGIWYLVRPVFAEEEVGPPTAAERALRALVILLSALAALVALYLIAQVLVEGGDWTAERSGPLAFLGSFLADLGEILEVATPVLSVVAAIGVSISQAVRLGRFLLRLLPTPAVAVLTVVSGALAGLVVGGLLGIAVKWLYQLADVLTAIGGPAAVGALIGLGLTARNVSNQSVRMGLSVYYLSRTVFNALRSIEPLILAIVFVVWVGIGPFAGTIALALHTTAALAKLYSEQVESILPGPLEALRATGATRMQTVVYAVVPQIVAPYIAFTMYRWDINVRVSTIIGFAGGGGIGFLLLQNINLLQYRAASTQMLAIAIVVASMDYASSRLRERFV